jgi:GNAT superfamily N-acetyltransferase
VIATGRLVPSDRAAWEALFRAYIDFYHRAEPPELYDRTWREFQVDTRLHALGARLEGRLVGITHFFVHPSTSGPDVCYLQDLFTAPDARGQGVARALIAAVADWARERGCGRVYWHTQASNTTARHLYDKVAENRGFIQYLIELAPAGPSIPLPGGRAPSARGGRRGRAALSSTYLRMGVAPCTLLCAGCHIHTI